MGTCIKCKKVYSTFDMVGGCCKNCMPAEKFERIKKIEQEVNEYQNEVAQQESSTYTKSILGFIFSFLLLNGLIYGTQEIYYMGDVEKCESIEVTLDRMKKDILKSDKYFESRKIEKENILSLKKKIEQNHSNQYTRYNSLIDSYNQGMPEYKSRLTNYNKQIDNYNDLTQKYNKLAQSAYSRWWLLPIPISRHM